ncbi:MAG: DUF58 domain-containing protein [Bacteroidetes bacterium]|nr:DUF58 domain-containing protein [Bacteroidota bacterium]
MNNSNSKNKNLTTTNTAKDLKGFYLSYYLSPTFYMVGAAICTVFALSFFFSVLFFIAKILITLLVFFTLIDTLFSISPFQQQQIHYYIKPFNRGEYDFGSTLAFVSSPIKLVTRRFNFNNSQIIYVYPSYIQMQKFSLQGVSSNSQIGSKKVRKLGNSLEFEQIKDYVQGDDYRTINWKATARKSQLMVNTYVDEKSQQVFCLIDKSRNMKMPFEGMTLLDYSINASLALSNIAIQKQDKVGLISFAEKMDNFVQADSKPMQMEALLQKLYKQTTQFKDADYEALYAQIRGRVKQRSLLLLFTNFESEYSLQRQLPYLKAIAHYHLLVVVFFENTELKKILHSSAQNTEEIYIQTIADKFMYEKKLMLKELRANGITALLTTPTQLTVSTINKYLEIKNRQQL